MSRHGRKQPASTNILQRLRKLALAIIDCILKACIGIFIVDDGIGMVRSRQELYGLQRAKKENDTHWKVAAAPGIISIAQYVLANPLCSSPVERPPAPAYCTSFNQLKAMR